MSEPTPHQRAAIGRPLARPMVVTGPLPPAPAGDTASPAEAVDFDPEAMSRLAAAAMNDAALADFAAEAPPPLAMDAKAGAPISVDLFYADVVADSVEVIAVLARNRFEGPSSRRPDDERRILELADAVLATGPACVASTLAFWKQASSSPDPWKTWAPVFTLATISGPESLSALLAGLQDLPPAALAQATVAAEALALVPRPDSSSLDAKLAESKHAVSRAVHLDLRTRAGHLSGSDLARALSDPEPAVADAALRALNRMEPVFATAAGAVHALLAHPSRVVAWRAARALTLRGDSRPLAAVREGGPLAAHLGPFALELFVLAGTESDLATMDTLLSTMKPTPAVLSAIGRFGHARSFSFLAFFLQDAALSDAAASSLETLFGERVPPAERRRPDAWNRAVAALGPDPKARLRRGEPWRPSALGDEIRTGTLGRMAISARADELRSRAGVTAPVDLGAWGSDFTERLADLVRAATAEGAQGQPGAWTVPLTRGTIGA